MKTNKENSANSEKETPDTPETIDALTRAMPRRKIDATCIAEVAQLCAKKMLTESEACRKLNIKPRTWFDWKSRCGRTGKFAELLEAYRADRIESLIDRMEKSANGVDLKYPDWRAALALLKIIDQRRFGDNLTVQSGDPIIDVNVPGLPSVRMPQSEWHGIVDKALKKVYAEPKAIDTTATVKQLPAPIQTASATALVSEPSGTNDP